MRVECPHCDFHFEAPEEDAGKLIHCGACGGRMQLPEAGDPEGPQDPEYFEDAEEAEDLEESEEFEDVEEPDEFEEEPDEEYREYDEQDSADNDVNGAVGEEPVLPQAAGLPSSPAQGSLPPVPFSGPPETPGGQAAKKCIYCGRQVPVSTRNCGHCGALLSGPAPARHAAPGRPLPEAGGAEGEAVGALVLGLLGLLMICIPAFPILAGSGAVFLGRRGRARNPSSSAAQAGFVLGVISLVVGIPVFFLQMIGCLVRA